MLYTNLFCQKILLFSYLILASKNSLERKVVSLKKQNTLNQYKRNTSIIIPTFFRLIASENLADMHQNINKMVLLF